MKRKKLAAFGLVIALTASSSSAAFAAAVPAASNMETTAVQQMDQAEETDTDILSDSEAVELQQEIASYSNDGILLTAAAPSTIGGVATTDIINAAKVMIRKYEGSYSSVNANDNGALSIGKMPVACGSCEKPSADYYFRRCCKCTGDPWRCTVQRDSQ